MNSHQRGIASILLQEGQRLGATPRELKALMEAGIVESGLANLSGGDRDSAGVLQQRPSQGWGSYGQVTNPRYAARKFLQKARQVNRRGFHGSAGELAQAVQRSGFPGRYDQHSGEAESIISALGGGRGVGGRAGLDGGGSSGSAGAPQSSQVSPGGTGLADLLAASMDRPQVQVSAPTPPSFTRGPVMPKGYQQVESSGPAAPQGASLDDLLSAVGSLQGPDLPSAAPSASHASRKRSRDVPGHVAMAGGGAYPAARHGKLIGVPYQGTHALDGSWQSDNAVDLGMPDGTPIIARASGTITKAHMGSGGRFAGWQVTLGNNKNAYFYGHLSRVKVKPGQRVRKGQIIGYSGSANGVQHLHFATEHGNPLDLLGLR